MALQTICCSAHGPVVIKKAIGICPLPAFLTQPASLVLVFVFEKLGQNLPVETVGRLVLGNSRLGLDEAAFILDLCFGPIFFQLPLIVLQRLAPILLANVLLGDDADML